MTEQERAQQVSRSEVLEARARLDSARGTIGNLLKAGQLDSSLLSALQALADSLTFMGGYEAFVDGLDRRVGLLDTLRPDLIRRYNEQTYDLLGFLEMIARLPDDVDRQAAGADELLEQNVELLREIASDTDLANTDLLNAVEQQYVATMTLRNSFNLWRRTLQATSKAETAADAAAESAGEVSEASLSSEFESLARDEKRPADRFRLATIVFLVGVVVYTGLVAYRSQAEGLDLLRKLALGVPVLLLAEFFRRESMRHRRVENWASVLSAQLRSVRAYSASLPPDESATLRLELGRRAFLESPATTASSGTLPSEDASLSVDAGLVREVTELARLAREKAPVGG
jgi:hypothetical protein